MARWFWRRPEKIGQGELALTFTEGGIEYQISGAGLPSQAVEWLRDPGLFDDWEQVACLAQIEAEGYAVTQDELLLLGWEEAFQLLATQEYRDGERLLGLPQSIELRPVLMARGSVSDPNFNIALDWRSADGGSLSTVITRTGAVMRLQGQEYLLSESAWRVATAVQDFARRPDEKRTQQAQECAWGHIRQLAVAASAGLDLYLERTIILTVEQLDLALRHVEVTDTPVIEVIPRVPGAPDERWLKAFDGFNQVREHYDLTTDKGELIRVLVEPDAQAVLAEIKRMPGRRIAGERAEAFLRNPYALLGDAMARVVPPERFEQAREAAGVRFYTFRDEICREPDGHVRAVRLLLEPVDEDAPTLPSIELADRVILQRFVDIKRRPRSGPALFPVGTAYTRTAW